MGNIGVWLMIIYGILFTAIYIIQIVKKEIVPTTASWVIFSLATGMSLFTYINTGNSTFESGIMNLTDFTADTVILIVIIYLGYRGTHLEPFEKWYLGGIVTIFFYWIFFNNSFTTNVVTQMLITIGYIPTIQRMIIEKRNTESFLAWGLAIIGCITGFYLTCNDYLSYLYAGRALLCVTAVFVTMIYYNFFYKKTT